MLIYIKAWGRSGAGETLGELMSWQGIIAPCRFLPLDPAVQF